MSSSATSNTPGITLMGIGNMGLALALAFLKSRKSDSAGQLTIWNRTTTRPQVQTAISAGAVLEPDLATALLQNDIIIVCLLDYETMKAAFAASENSTATAALAGKTLINLTNGTLRQAREMKSWAVDVAGVKAYFDGAVMVTPQMVGGPHSFLVVSGGGGGDESAVVKHVTNLLAPLGRVEYLGGDETIEAAARFDLAALACMYGMFAGGFVGMGLLKRQGPIGPVIKDKIIPFLTALVPYLGLIADSWDDQRWDDNLGNPVGMQLQGLRNIIAACREEGVEEMGALEGLAGLMGRVVERYGSDAGVAGVGELLLEKGVVSR